MVNVLLFLLLGFKSNSTTWSNLRRASNRLSIALIGLLLYEMNSYDALAYPDQIATFVVAWSIAFFVFSVASVIYLGGSETQFDPAPFRLIGDIFVSGAMSITAFSLAYRLHGLIDTLEAQSVASKIDYLYFSIVSFSTLGYGISASRTPVAFWRGPMPS